ncbi:MAG: L,D-transpeptidase family protein, partial [Ferruginibacter sp.]
ADEEKSFRSFYNYRNLQFAWFTSQGLTEQAKGFWNLQDQLGSKADKSLRNRMDTLLNNDSLVISRFDTSIQNTELALTRAYLVFYNANREKTQFANISPEKAIPVKKQNVMVWADTIIQQRADSSMAPSSQYVRLKQKLQIYHAFAKQGGNWEIIPASAKQLKKGSSSQAVSQIKRKLQIMSGMPVTDTSATFNDSLTSLIKSYQAGSRMKTTGLITDSLLRSLNVPLEKRMQQIIINLTRAQWMPANTDGNYISVNIPDYLLTVYENNTKAFDMPVAVGKEGTNTTMFTGDLNQVVFSPYWNIPASIVQNEILPKMRTNPNYLKSRNMEQVGKNDSLPIIRQLPGKDNSLGKVKFLFPNRYDIYFHDTNAKEVFNRTDRAVSHGCIRLADAEKMANYLLRNDKAWTPEKVNAAMNAKKEQYVKLNTAMPVVITYYTAWVDESGTLNLRDDLYGIDVKVAQMMFESSAVMNPQFNKDSIVRKM